MTTLSRIKSWNVGDTLTAADLNAEFNNIMNDYNGSIANANISGSAAIDDSKISFTKPYFQGSYQALTTVSEGSPTTINCNLSNIFSLTLTANRTLAISNVTVGQLFMVRIIQGGSGGYSITSWWSGIKWPSQTAPTLTTTVGAVDAFVFLCTGSGAYDAYFAGFDLRA